MTVNSRAIFGEPFATPEDARQWMADWYSLPTSERGIPKRKEVQVQSGTTEQLPTIYVPNDPEFAPGSEQAAPVFPQATSTASDAETWNRVLDMVLMLTMLAVVGGMLGGAIIWYLLTTQT